MFKNPIWQEATRCLFTNPTKGLNSGLPRNHASQRSERDCNSVSTNLGRGWTRLGIDRSWLQELQCKSHACAKHSTSLPARWDVGDMIDLPTSWSRFLYEREARAVDFLCFLRKKRARERASRWGQLPEPEMRSKGLWESLKIWQWTRTCLAIFLNFTKSLKRLHKLARSGEYS